MTAGVKIKFGQAASNGCATFIVVLVGLVFLSAGLLFAGFVGRDFLRTARTYGWPQAECTILKSSVRETDDAGRPLGNFQFDVEYRYEFRGQSYTARQYALKTEDFPDYSAAQRLSRRYAPGTQTHCFVNPAAPTIAVLHRASLWIGLLILFPLVFVAIGGGLLYWQFRSIILGRQADAAETALRQQPISERASGRAGRRFMVVFFLFFTAMGGVAFYFTTVKPLLGIVAAQGWQRTPCVVLTSEVKSHSSDDGTTYSVSILYRYVVGGQEFKSNRYKFMGGSSSGYRSKAAIVRRYPPGTETFCWVNPRDPTDAVIDRGFTADMGWGFLTLLFVAIGAGGLIYTFRTRTAQAGSTLTAKPGGGRPALKLKDGPVWRAGVDYWDPTPKQMKPAVPPLGKLIGALFVAAFWNGIVSVFVVQCVQSWLHHRPEYFLTVFLIPFVAIGLFLIGYLIYTVLALFNARPKLTLTPGLPALGDPVEVRWELSGRTSGIERLRIHLEGREQAQYRRGTDTVTDKSVFAHIEITNTTDRLAIHGGQARVSLPADLMHSFASSNNKITWSLHVRGEIARWPDVNEEFPITVAPRRPSGARPSVSLPV